MTPRRLHGILFLFFVVCAVPPAMAGSAAGEIININYKYRTAFADLTSAEVHAGDRVAVLLADGQEIELNVVEVYPVMIKLTAPAGLPDEKFSRIPVGAKVAVRRAAVVPSGKVAPPAEDPALPATVTTFAPAGSGRAGVPVSGELSSGTADSRLEKLLASNIELTGQVARLLADRETESRKQLEENGTARDAEDRVRSLSADNAALTEKVRLMDAEIVRLRADKSAAEQQVGELNEKLTALKQKLARMAAIINRNPVAHE